MQQQKAMKASTMSAFMPFSPPNFLSEHHAPPSHMALPPRIPETRLRSSMSVRCPQEDEACKKMEMESTVDVISVAPSTEMLYNPSDSYAMTLLLAPSNTMPYNSSGFREADHSLFDTAPPCSSLPRAAGEQDSAHMLTPPSMLAIPLSSAQGAMAAAASNERKDEVSMHIPRPSRKLAWCKKLISLIIFPRNVPRAPWL